MVPGVVGGISIEGGGIGLQPTPLPLPVALPATAVTPAEDVLPAPQKRRQHVIKDRGGNLVDLSQLSSPESAFSAGHGPGANPTPKDHGPGAATAKSAESLVPKTEEPTGIAPDAAKLDSDHPVEDEGVQLDVTGSGTTPEGAGSNETSDSVQHGAEVVDPPESLSHAVEVDGGVIEESNQGDTSAVVLPLPANEWKAVEVVVEETVNASSPPPVETGSSGVEGISPQSDVVTEPLEVSDAVLSVDRETEPTEIEPLQEFIAPEIAPDVVPAVSSVEIIGEPVVESDTLSAEEEHVMPSGVGEGPPERITEDVDVVDDEVGNITAPQEEVVEQEEQNDEDHADPADETGGEESAAVAMVGDDEEEEDWMDAVVDLSVAPKQPQVHDLPDKEVSEEEEMKTSSTELGAAGGAKTSRKANKVKKYADVDARLGDQLDAYRNEPLPGAPLVNNDVVRGLPSDTTEKGGQRVGAHDPKASLELPGSSSVTSDIHDAIGESKAGGALSDPPKVERTLRPQGAKKLNEGPKVHEKTRFVYLREDILKLRPNPLPERPSSLMGYSVYSSNGNDATRGGRGAMSATSSSFPDRRHQQHGQNSHELRWTKSTSLAPHVGYQESRLTSDERNHGGNQVSPTVGNAGAQSWQRMSLPNIPPPSLAQGQNIRRQKTPSGPMPRKAITDPLEVMTRDVQAILNKITPQTFPKLTQQLCDMPLLNCTMLERLIHLVFEKAIQEPNFADLYAGMISSLESQGRYWSFLQVIFASPA